MRVAFGTDEETPVTESLRAGLTTAGHDVVAVAPGAEWPEVGRAVGEAVAHGEADIGVVCCWTGTGVSIAANKVAGVRAALCNDVETASGARRWNDANVLAIGLRSATPEASQAILDAFISTGPDPEEAAAIARVERGGDD